MNTIGVNGVRKTNFTTTPIGIFEASFQSESGKSSTGFEISAAMYFLSVGFPRWDGYTVYNDPELAIYTYKGTVKNILPNSNLMPLILLTTILTAAIIVTAVAIKKGYLRLPRRKDTSGIDNCQTASTENI